MDRKSPFSVSFDLGTLSDKGAEASLAPNPAERAAIAGWLGIVALENLTAQIRLSRQDGDRFGYEAIFEADVVQACVITLEPVRAHLTGEFRRNFQFLSSPSGRRRQLHPRGEISLTEEEEPEILASPILDLAAPVLEELNLSLDPYPKAPGAKFETAPASEARSESPFAVLEKLKSSQGKSDEAASPPAASPMSKPKRKPKRDT